MRIHSVNLCSDFDHFISTGTARDRFDSGGHSEVTVVTCFVPFSPIQRPPTVKNFKLGFRQFHTLIGPFRRWIIDKVGRVSDVMKPFNLFSFCLFFRLSRGKGDTLCNLFRIPPVMHRPIDVHLT